MAVGIKALRRAWTLAQTCPMTSDNPHPKKPSPFARTLLMLVGEQPANLDTIPPAREEKPPNSVPNEDKDPKPKDPDGDSHGTST